MDTHTQIPSRRQYWAVINRQSWLLLLIGILILALFRTLLLIFEAPEDLETSSKTLFDLYWTGLRFDAKLMSIVIAPNILFTTLLLAFPKRVIQFWKSAWLIWAFVALFAIILLSFINHYFFNFYQGPINPLVFGFFEDDTQAILKTVWNDMPFIRLLFALFALCIAPIFLIRWLTQKPIKKRSKLVATLTVIGSIIVVLLVARGSIGVFPLSKMHMAISEHPFINNLVPAGANAAFNAWEERQATQLGKDPLKGLMRYGFESPNAAVQAIKPNTTAEQLLFEQRGQRNASLAKPHVVFSIMESWGQALLDFDDPKDNDLLGRLRPWINGELDYFPHALSSENGTHPSLEALLLDSPITPLTQGAYAHIQYNTSVANVFKKAGYRTVFLTAGSSGWRGLEKALAHQGFDQVIGQSALLNAYPNASQAVWGVDDEWMYQYAINLLTESKEPLFLVLLSITNHPPYRVPDSYQPYPLDVNRLGNALASSPALGASIMETYQYANDALGGFLNTLRDKKLLDNILFAASGDHNSRSIFSYKNSTDVFKKFGVPIVLRIPEAYRTGVAQTQDWVSHQDIISTLFTHALNQQTVPRIGRNLYQAVDSPYAISFSDQDGGKGVFVNEHGAMTNFAQPIYHHWNEDRSALVRTQTPSTALLNSSRQARAWFALRDWRIRIQALGKGKQPKQANIRSEKTNTQNP